MQSAEALRPRVVFLGAVFAVLHCAFCVLHSAGCASPSRSAALDAAGRARLDQARLAAAVQIAEQRMAAGKLAEAREDLLRFDSAPDARLQLTLARLDLEEGNYQAALERLDRHPQLGEQSAEYHRWRGVALEGLGRWAEAAEACRAAWALQPAADLLIAWVDALLLAGQTEQACDVLARGRAAFPGHAGIQVAAARVWQQAGQLAAAIRELETAARAEPAAREIRRQLAEAYFAAGRYSDASRIWRELIADAERGTGSREQGSGIGDQGSVSPIFDPRSPSPDQRSREALEQQHLRRRLATCLAMAGQLDEAHRLYRGLLAQQPEDDSLRLALAAVALAAGQPAEALEAANSVLRKRPDQFDARLIVALSYRQLGQTGTAIEILSTAGRVIDPTARRAQECRDDDPTYTLGPSTDCRAPVSERQAAQVRELLARWQ